MDKVMATGNTISKEGPLSLSYSQPSIKKIFFSIREKFPRKQVTFFSSFTFKSKAPKVKQEENQSGDHHACVYKYLHGAK